MGGRAGEAVHHREPVPCVLIAGNLGPGRAGLVLAIFVSAMVALVEAINCLIHLRR